MVKCPFEKGKDCDVEVAKDFYQTVCSGWGGKGRLWKKEECYQEKLKIGFVSAETRALYDVHSETFRKPAVED